MASEDILINSGETLLNAEGVNVTLFRNAAGDLVQAIPTEIVGTAGKYNNATGELMSGLSVFQWIMFAAVIAFGLYTIYWTWKNKERLTRDINHAVEIMLKDSKNPKLQDLGNQLEEERKNDSENKN
jgi:hypothetical protein